MLASLALQLVPLRYGDRHAGGDRYKFYAITYWRTVLGGRAALMLVVVAVARDEIQPYVSEVHAESGQSIGEYKLRE